MELEVEFNFTLLWIEHHEENSDIKSSKEDLSTLELTTDLIDICIDWY